MTEYKMLKIPEETWTRLNEFRGKHERTYPRVTSLHNAISVLLDLQQSSIDQGGEIEIFRKQSGSYYDRDVQSNGKMTFPVGLVKSEEDGPESG